MPEILSEKRVFTEVDLRVVYAWLAVAARARLLIESGRRIDGRDIEFMDLDLNRKRPFPMVKSQPVLVLAGFYGKDVDKDVCGEDLINVVNAYDPDIDAERSMGQSRVRVREQLFPGAFGGNGKYGPLFRDKVLQETYQDLMIDNEHLLPLVAMLFDGELRRSVTRRGASPKKRRRGGSVRDAQVRREEMADQRRFSEPNLDAYDFPETITICGETKPVADWVSRIDEVMDLWESIKTKPFVQGLKTIASEVAKEIVEPAFKNGQYCQLNALGLNSPTTSELAELQVKLNRRISNMDFSRCPSLARRLHLQSFERMVHVKGKRGDDKQFRVDARFLEADPRGGINQQIIRVLQQGEARASGGQRRWG